MATHILQSGDYPWSLAVKYVQNGNRWPELCKANPTFKAHATYGCVFPKIGTAINLPDSWVSTSSITTTVTPTSTTIVTTPASSLLNQISSLFGKPPVDVNIQATSTGQQTTVTTQTATPGTASATTPGTTVQAATNTLIPSSASVQPSAATTTAKSSSGEYVKIGLVAAGIIALGFIIYQGLSPKSGEHSVEDSGPKTAKMKSNRRRSRKGKRKAKARKGHRKMRRNPAESYDIVRMYQKGGNRIIKKGLTLKEAQEHCRDPESSSSTCTNQVGKLRTKRQGPWFDGYQDSFKKR
jgi:hypothetical protein